MNTHRNIIKVTFGGDVMCLREETSAVIQNLNRLDYTSYVEGLRGLFESSDYVCVNLETPIDDTQPPTDSSVRFNTSSELLKPLKAIGVDFVSTANNHCLDRGVQGLCATIDALDAVGLAHDGTFKTKTVAEDLFAIDVHGLRIAIIPSTFGTNSQLNGVLLPEDEMWRVALFKKQPKLRKLPKSVSLEGGDVATYIADEVLPVAISNPCNETLLERQLEKIRWAKKVSDVVIAMPHIGGQYNPAPATYTKYVVGRMKQAGAHFVIAGHSHVPHRCEVSKGGRGCIAYSLGNLCFTPSVGFFVKNVLSEYGIVLHLYMDKCTKTLHKLTFDVVKNFVEEDGMTRVLPVVDLLRDETNPARRDRLIMENEAVVNRFRGTSSEVIPQLEYEIRIDCGV